MTTNTEVNTEVTALPSLPAAYTAESLEDLFAKVKAEVEAHVPDIETVEGRKHIKALAAKISSSKTAIDKPMRDYLREIKALPKVVEKNARESVERFDALRDATLKPLNEAQAHQDAIIARMDEIVRLCSQDGLQSGTVRLWFDEAIAIDVETTFWPELIKKAKASVEGALAATYSTGLRLEAAEKQAAELERLRKESEENARRERDRLIAEEAARKAQEEERQRAEQRILDERNKAEKDRMEKLKAERDKAEAEQRLAAQQEQAKRDAELAEQQAKERERIAAENAKKQAEEQQALALQRQKEEEEKRAADKAHRVSINRAALADLIAQASLTEEQAKAVITAVAKGLVANMKVIY
ncbi:MAG: hypothetical protein GYA32_10520 [Serratia sp.]|nr:hypothetical protein [Serratia sp. (in: enterobacteria)]